MILWRQQGLVYKIISISEPQLLAGRDSLEPSITLEVTIPLPSMKHGQEAMLPDMFRVVNPQAQEKLDKLVMHATTPSAKPS